MCRLDHPNVVSVYNRGEEGADLWVAMQQADHDALVDGIFGPETRAKAMLWPVYRVDDGSSDGRCAPAL